MKIIVSDVRGVTSWGTLQIGWIGNGKTGSDARGMSVEQERVIV